jgi:hypothetical protein
VRGRHAGYPNELRAPGILELMNTGETVDESSYWWCLQVFEKYGVEGKVERKIIRRGGKLIYPSAERSFELAVTAVKAGAQ